MDQRDKEFNTRLLQTFRVEAEEHIHAITSGLIELEKTSTPDNSAEIIEALFRQVHSLKGAARSVNMREIESVCQPLETVFFRLKLGEILCEPNLCDLCHRGMDFLTQLVAGLEEKRTSAERASQKELIKQLESFAKIDGIAPKPANSLPEPLEDISVGALRQKEKETGPGQTVRILVSKLDSLLFQAEEMIQSKVTTQQLVIELREIKNTLVVRKTGGTPNELAKWCESHLDNLHARISAVSQVAEQDFRALRRIVDDHLEAMKQVLMLPAASLTEAFPKIVRDLSRQQGKEIDLVISGADIEIDKRILEELKDPLIHLMRNCTDHGIEKPDERVNQKKSPTGKITLAFTTNDSRQVEINISDDGAGIDINNIREMAIKSGIISPESAASLDAGETIALIFQSGFTTSPIITDISGRGLGLAIVSEKIEKLGGVVTVETVSHAGTTFRLRLPVSLATFRGVIVRAGGNLFIIPTTNVERAIRIKLEEIKTVENCETVKLDGKILSLVHLSDVLGLKAGSTSCADRVTIVVLGSGDTQIAFLVDEVLDELQVLVKSLGKQLSRVRNISGATILGNGKVVPVLNVHDLLKSALQSPSIRKHQESEDVAKVSLKVLVAEDSITSRTLLKTILETAGFLVTTAVDGADAFAQLRAGEFDLLVSDVDMPRMSGFELTAKVRSDKKISELPVVLVTALESREDRERGIDAGANAYIVKSSFDQSNLLEVINKLI